MTKKRDEELCDTNKLQTIVQSCFVLILCNKSIVCCSPGFWIVFYQFLHLLSPLFASGKDPATESKAKIRPERESGPIDRYGQKKWRMVYLICAVIAKFSMSTPTQNQQEQYCKQTSSIYYIERIPPLGYFMNLYQLQIRKICVEKSYKRTHCI